MTNKYLIALTFSLLAMPATVMAYELTGFSWSRPVPYEINTSSSQELGRDTTLEVVTASYAMWRDPDCSDFEYTYEGETTDDFRTGDQVNTLVWRYDGSSFPRELGGASTIGVTLSSAYGGRAIDGDIVFNGIDHTWVVGANRWGEVDAQSIITHEIGHQLGLDHSPLQNATMYAAYLGGNGARNISNDDIAGVCSLYPSGEDVECTNNSDCSGDQICSGGNCIDGSSAPPSGGIGAPCGMSQNDCDPGLFCVGDQNGSTFCTRQCGEGCPVGWSCQEVRFGRGQRAQICLEDENDPVGRGEFGDPCNAGYNCATGFCVSNGNDAFCSQACGGDEDCPEGSECAPLSNGGGACLPVNGGSGDGQTPGNGEDGVLNGSDASAASGENGDAGVSGGTTGIFGDDPNNPFPDDEASAESGCACEQGFRGAPSFLILASFVMLGALRRRCLLGSIE